MKNSVWVCALLAFCFSFAIVVGPSQAAGPKAPSGIADGPGIWMNLWSYPTGDLESYCLKLHNHGIRNLFIQTSRSNTESLRDTERLGKLIDTCHKYKIRVIAWSFSFLDSPLSDAKKLIEAARFKTPAGSGFDGIAANLEKDLTTSKVEQYSKFLRDELGFEYPMLAVVYSPLNKAPQVAHTPWKLLDKYYDVIAPMNYWNSKYKKFDPYDYTRDTVNQVRALVGRPDVEVHVIGDGMKTNGSEIKSFMKACMDSGATSASLYPFHQVTDEQYRTLSSYSEYFPVNSRFRLASFKSLRASGAFSGMGLDPSKPIKRGEYYQLVAARLTGKNNLDSVSAIRILSGYGFLKDIPVSSVELEESRILEAAIDQKEAYVLAAALVEASQRAAKLGIVTDGVEPRDLFKKRKKRVDRWFVQPVSAETSHDRFQSLNYLDAAQIILVASPQTSP
ncbi:MAG: hypothetical protein K8F91_03495 [Candidatus Obscuribacterales bacterium]|nr:hypothetical protein [Candidatus Obscuribacterales bacterium]